MSAFSGADLAAVQGAQPAPVADPIDTFRQAIADAGLPVPNEIIGDGRIHRFSTNGKPGDKAGAYALHLDGTPAGYFECWRQGIKQKWSSKNGAKPDAGELQRLKATIDHAERERAANQRHRAETARQLWNAAEPANADHPYLVKKRIQTPPGIRQASIDRAVFFNDETKAGTMKNCLLVPAETPDGMQSLQAIAPDGNKAFMTGAAMRGAYCTLAGDSATVCLAEGLATAQSIHEATGSTVVAAFNSGNLAKVAERIRAESLDARIVVAGDNDHANPDNPGKDAAEKAAKACGGRVALPPAGDHGTDWNDYHVTHGLASVRAEIESAGRLPEAESDLTLSSAAESAQQAPTQDAEEKAGPSFGYTLVGSMVDHLKPIDWQVKGFLEADSLGLIYGPPKSGKSFLAIDWACSIATGTEWNGRKVKQGAVFYLAGEGHNGLARRFASWQLAKGVTLKDAPLAVSNKAAPLTDRPAAAAVLESIQHLADTTGQAPAVIVVDTLARNFGGDENATEEMSRFIQHLDEIRANWQCTVLVVHHTGKDKTRGARGNTALTGAIDAGYMIDRDELGNVALEPTEMKDAELPAPLTFNLEGVKLPMVDEDGNDVYGAHLAPMDRDYQPPQRGRAGRGKNQTQALAKLAALTRDHQDRLANDDRDPCEARVTIADWRHACLDNGMKPPRFSEARKGLEDAGLVEVTEPYAHPVGQ